MGRAARGRHSSRCRDDATGVARVTRSGPQRWNDARDCGHARIIRCGRSKRNRTSGLYRDPGTSVSFDLGAIAKTPDAVRAVRRPAAIVLTQCRAVGTEAAEMRTAVADVGVEVLPETVGVRVAFVVAITGGLAVTAFERHDSPAVVEIRALYAALKGRLNGQ